MDVFGLYTGECHLGRSGSPPLLHGEAISCLGKPALWPGFPNLETITVGLPASVAQRLHRFNISVHIGSGRGFLNVTQQKRHPQRDCSASDGREKGTKEVKNKGCGIMAQKWRKSVGGKEKCGTKMVRKVARRNSVNLQTHRSGTGSALKGVDGSVGTDPVQDLLL